MSQLSLKPFNHVFVLGSGLMGAGIAQVVAEAGIEVVLYDVNEESLGRGKKQIERDLQRKKDVSVDEVISRITFTRELKDGQDCELVIEAVPEKLELKKEIFNQLDEMMNDDAILASNTSSLSIAAIGSATNRPEKVIGLHFFSPVPIMKLLEVVVSISTSEEVIEKSKQFAETIQKEVIIAQDYPGFTVNRVLVPMMNEAAYLVLEGNDPEDIDKGMIYGANHPVGPLKLADLVGIDVLLFTLESLYEGFNDSKYRPCPLLKRMVESGHLGRKSGKGFYNY